MAPKKGMKVPRPFDAVVHCGAKGRSGKPCRNFKGQRTTHPGQGRCWKHGGISRKGDRRVKTGLYQSVTTESIKFALDRVEDLVGDQMDLTPEIKLLRAIVLDMSERYDKTTTALIAWNASYSDAVRTLATSNEAKAIKGAIVQLRAAMGQRPTQVVDFAQISVVVDRVGKMVERTHKMKADGTVSMQQLKGIYDKMVAAVIAVCDPEQVKKIERAWEGIAW